MAFNPFNREESIKKKANRTEKRIGKKFDLQKQPSSGAISGFKGDLKNKKFLFDVKSTEAKSIRVDWDMLYKIRREAFGSGKEPVIVLAFTKLEQCEQEYAVIPMSLFKEITEAK